MTSNNREGSLLYILSKKFPGLNMSKIELIWEATLWSNHQTLTLVIVDSTSSKKYIFERLSCTSVIESYNVVAPRLIWFEADFKV